MKTPRYDLIDYAFVAGVIALLFVIIGGSL